MKVFFLGVCYWAHGKDGAGDFPSQKRKYKEGGRDSKKWGGLVGVKGGNMEGGWGNPARRGFG